MAGNHCAALSGPLPVVAVTVTVGGGSPDLHPAVTPGPGAASAASCRPCAPCRTPPPSGGLISPTTTCAAPSLSCRPQVCWPQHPPSEPCPCAPGPQFGADSVCRVAPQTLELRPAETRTVVRCLCIHQTGLPRRRVSCCCAAGLSLLNGLLTYDATRRMTVAGALEHEYFRVSETGAAAGCCCVEARQFCMCGSC